MQQVSSILLNAEKKYLISRNKVNKPKNYLSLIVAFKGKAFLSLTDKEFLVDFCAFRELRLNIVRVLLGTDEATEKE